MSETERIESDTVLQMDLSELLFRALNPESCWHMSEPYKVEGLISYHSRPALCVRCKAPYVWQDMNGQWFDAMGYMSATVTFLKERVS